MTDFKDSKEGNIELSSHGDAARKGWWAVVTACSGTAADRRNQYWFLLWLFGWAVTYVATTWLLTSAAGLAGGAALAIALVPNVFAVAALLAYLKFLREADEMIRQIQLQGLAFGFGAGVIFAMGYGVLEHAGAPTLDLNAIATVMMVGWALGQLLAMKRYV